MHYRPIQPNPSPTSAKPSIIWGREIYRGVPISMTAQYLRVAELDPWDTPQSVGLIERR